MNTNAIKKHYDKLTVEERVSAMIAARGRDDIEEYKTLGQTAPFGKTFRVHDYHGLLDAWEWLAMWHMMNQLGEIATLYFVLFHTEGENPVNAIKVNHHGAGEMKTELYNPDDVIQLVMRRIVEGREAWRTVCREHNLDPNDALSRLPYIETIEIAGLIAECLLHEVDIQPDPEEVLNAYREVIRRKRAEWE